MTAPIRNTLILVLGIALGMSLVMDRSVLADRSSGTQTGGLPLQELRTFSTVFQKIKTDYVEPVSDKALLNSA
ncbi:MAG: S41 family peptidase, partial [Gammaproteobacteria bacterium]